MRSVQRSLAPHRCTPPAINNSSNRGGIVNARLHISRGNPVNALVLVPTFSNTSGPLLGPAMLAGAARRAGHRVQVLDLAREWMIDHHAVPRNESVFIGDHDKPSESLRLFQEHWCSLCAEGWPSGLDSEQHEEVIVHLKAGFDEVEAAASAFATPRLEPGSNERSVKQRRPNSWASQCCIPAK